MSIKSGKWIRRMTEQRRMIEPFEQGQVLFFESDEVCETSYQDRGGKYQGQVGATLPKI